MSQELEKQYSPATTEKAVYEKWTKAKAFAATPDDREKRYVVMMPLPNVTGALHMGHAMDNVMQDLLTRWHRMQGDNALWMAGTDHAGISTQAVVEKRLLELEGKTRHDLGRDGLVKRIWQWKEEYQQRIIRQQQAMGCSCDWDRQRFTMDAVCTRAVRHTFFRLFADRLIYRGDRLINWDCHLQTAVSDDEIYYETVRGNFWHIRYKVVDPKAGEPTELVVATTRPETMFGDTAVAVHPDPEAALTTLIRDTKAKLAAAPAKERSAIEAELKRIEERVSTHLPTLKKLAGMAKAGRKVRIPLVEREVPLILDTWAKPELGSGCVKITPAHDFNDYEVWKRHRDEIGILNMLNPEGTLNDRTGRYAGVDRAKGRKLIVADLKTCDAIEQEEERTVELAHSDRSKTVIEPYLSKQWFIRMADVDGKVTCGRGTDKEFTTPGLAQAAIDAVEGRWKSATGRMVTFWPDSERYRSTYTSWLGEKRDWCISRQLWWGHQIPVWTKVVDAAGLRQLEETLVELRKHDEACVRIVPLEDNANLSEVQVCLRDVGADAKLGTILERAELRRDPDVLDTWFSSALWPHSTLGWPNPEDAPVDAGQSPLGSQNGKPNCLSYYYPTACLVTGRDIITLWVARMVVMGLYNIGDVPFTDVFIHATILDGKGERMSKSKGNGIDPVDIIEQYGTDAMRYILCDMQTGTQDIRLPVQAVSPFTGELVDLASAKHGRTIFSYLCPKTGKEFDVLGTLPDVPSAKVISDRFEVGRNFCNKVWNATRFALMNVEGTPFTSLDLRSLRPEDRWLLSKLTRATMQVQTQLSQYNPSAAVSAVRDFFWNDLCDWYVEIVKPRFRAGDQVAKQILAASLDTALRLLHPFVPFITEILWEKLCAAVPVRGITKPFSNAALLMHASWPTADVSWIDEAGEVRFDFARDVIRGIRDLRVKYKVSPAVKVAAQIKATGEARDTLVSLSPIIQLLAGLERLEVTSEVQRRADAATAFVQNVELFVSGVVDIEKERVRLTGQREKLTGIATNLRQRLSNAEFVAKAKPEIVEKEKQKLADLEAELASISLNLQSLG